MKEISRNLFSFRAFLLAPLTHFHGVIRMHYWVIPKYTGSALLYNSACTITALIYKASRLNMFKIKLIISSLVPFLTYAFSQLNKPHENSPYIHPKSRNYYFLFFSFLYNTHPNFSKSCLLSENFRFDNFSTMLLLTTYTIFIIIRHLPSPQLLCSLCTLYTLFTQNPCNHATFLPQHHQTFTWT